MKVVMLLVVFVLGIATATDEDADDTFSNAVRQLPFIERIEEDISALQALNVAQKERIAQLESSEDAMKIIVNGVIRKEDCVIKDVNFWGGDVAGPITVDNAGECNSVCLSYPTADLWLFHLNHRRECWCKVLGNIDMDHVTVSRVGTEAGIMSCKSCVMKDTLFAGGDISVTVASSPAACNVYCQTLDVDLWQYKMSTKMCYCKRVQHTRRMIVPGVGLEAGPMTCLKCPRGFVKLPGLQRCYKFVVDTVTQEQAKLACRDLGSQLIVIQSEAENTEVKTHLQKISLEAAWLSLERQEGVWLWGDNSVVDFSDWHPNQPDNSGGIENCAHMDKNRINGYMWNDLDCQRTIRTFGYICKI